MTKKIIVTHMRPDLDAVASCWLLQRFDPDWSQAEIRFVSAGSRYQSQADEEVVHVDTGGGKFDHHQAGSEDHKLTSAAKLVFDQKISSRLTKPEDRQAMARLVDLIVEIDNFRELNWPEADADRYDLGLAEIINAWTQIYPKDHQRVVTLGYMALDAVFLVFKDKVRAEVQIKASQEFMTPWGLGLAVVSGNTYIEHLAQKQGFVVVVKQNPDKKNIRIVARWDKQVDLTPVYDKLSQKDPDSTWFLHASKCMLLNGSRSNPNMKPTKLSLEEVVKIITDLSKPA